MFKRFIKLFATTMILAMISSVSSAADRGTPEEAIAMVKKAIAAIKTNGKEKAFVEIANLANKDFHDRDLYVFVYDMNGVAVTHGNNPRMVGKNLIDMKDGEGTPIIRRFIETANAQGKGWVDYKWPNPVTQTVESKSSYVEKLGDLVVGCGIYKR